MYPSEFAAAAEARSRFYWWLAEWLLDPPAQADLDNAREIVPGLAPSPSLGGALGGLRDAALNISGDDTEVRLCAEFTRLLGGVQQGLGPPPPFESVWREDRLMGETTLAVLQAYQQSGFAEIDLAAGPQDHLGVELKFLALLALREHEARQAGDEDRARQLVAQQLNFLRTHPMTWAPHWVRQISDHAQEALFARLAEVIQEFLELDHQHLLALESEKT